MSKEIRPIIIVKKVKKGHGHHGGAWKVAFADFMTAMMAFFMVMWIIGMNDPVKSAIEGYFSDPVGFMQGQANSSNLISLGGAPAAASLMPVQLIARQIEEQRYRDIGEQIQIELEGPDGLGDIAAQVEVVMTDQGLRIELVEGGDGEMFFGLGSSALKPAAARALQVIAGELRAASAPIVVEGHTDATPYAGASGYSNWELSADRANSARRALESGGLGANRVAEVRSHADRHLRIPGAPRDNANRRISILLPFSTAPAEVTTSVPAGT